ncbi:MAG: hypothetical protein ABJA66_11570, partial [Actinomycetota bacterium]
MNLYFDRRADSKLMSEKPYFSADNQWNEAVSLFRAEMNFFDEVQLGDAWFFGPIVRPHRLFITGDAVI